MEFHHISVLLDECIDALHIRPDGIYLDGTLGGAGHSSQIAQRLTTGRLISVDRDPVALQVAQERLAPWMDRVTLVHSNFREINRILDDLHIDKVDGMLFDLGVSSPQLDDGARGFSYMADAPLDMRMDGGDSLTAWEVVNHWPREELRRILFEYGEERYAPLIAAAIERRRGEKPIDTTLELVDVIKSAMPGQALREKQHPAKRSFQAIRIAVNGRIERRGRHDAGGHPPAESRRTAGGDHVPLPRGPDCEKRHGGGGQGLHLPAGVSGVRLRPYAPGAGGDPQAHCLRRRRAGAQSTGPQRQASGGGKTVIYNRKEWMSNGAEANRQTTGVSDQRRSGL